jgi:O-antigen ligase
MFERAELMPTTVGLSPSTAELLLRSGLQAQSRPVCTAAFPATRAVLFLMLLAAPLAFGSVQTPAWASLSISASLLLVLWVIESHRARVLQIAWSPLYVPAAGLLLLVGVQVLTGRALDSMGAREALLKLAGDCIVFFIAVQLWSRAREKFSAAPSGAWRMLGVVVTVYAFLLALFSVLQFFSSHGLIYWRVKTDGWVFGPYINHNHYAGLMEMLVPVSLTYAFYKRKKQGQTVLTAFAALFPVASVLLCGSRGGEIVMIFETVSLGLIIGWRGAVGDRRRVAILAVVSLLGLAALSVWLGGNRISSRLVTMAGLTRSPDVALGNRLLVARDTLRMFRDHLWLGTGLGSFAAVYPQYQSFATDMVYHHAHNDYLEAVAETGILGGLLIVLALLSFFDQFRRRLRTDLPTEAGWLQIGAAFGCGGILVHSLADFNLHIPANALWFAFLLGISQARV